MLAIAHILVCLLLIRLFSLDRNQAFAVLLFGFFIDLDHIFGMAEYISSNHGSGLLSVHHAMNSDIEWKSLMHQPVAFLIVAPVAVLFTFALPLLSWALHLLMDYAQIHYLGIASMPEMALTVAMAALLIWDDCRWYQLTNDDLITVRSFLDWELGRVRGEARNWLPSRTRKTPTSPVL